MSTENQDEPVNAVRKTITLPPDVQADGLRRAGEERRSFSNYISWLIERDALRRTEGQPAAPHQVA
jgi:predicted CopG family antitoxin